MVPHQDSTRILMHQLRFYNLRIQEDNNYTMHLRKNTTLRALHNKGCQCMGLTTKQQDLLHHLLACLKIHIAKCEGQGLSHVRQWLLKGSES